jgi:integrase
VTRFKLKYVLPDVDRYGTVRYYFRRNRADKKIRMPGLPGSSEFMTAYADALAGKLKPPQETKPVHQRPGTFYALAHGFYQWSGFKKLDARSQRVRQNILDEFLKTYGELPFIQFQRRHVRIAMEAKQKTPGAANNLLKALRHLFDYAVEFDLVQDDPTDGVKKLEYRKKPFHSWTIAEVEQFEKCWPIGSTPRLALCLLLYTGQRRQDVVKFGKQHIKDGWIKFTQQKSRHFENPIILEIPILPELQKAIDATPRKGLSLLEGPHGKPYTAAGFGMRFRKWCDEAGLAHCSAHGLRKATATRIADQGGTIHQISGVTGHRTLSEVARYTRAADQKNAAESGVKLINLPSKKKGV